MKIRDLSRHAREAAAKPPRGGPEAQTNRPEVNVRSFHESSFRQKGTLCPVDQLPLKALIKVLIRFYRLSLSLSLSLSLDRWWWFLCCSRPTAKAPEFSRFCLPFPFPASLRRKKYGKRTSAFRDLRSGSTAGMGFRSCLEKLDSS